MEPQTALIPKVVLVDFENRPSRNAAANASMILCLFSRLSLSRKISESRPIDLQYLIQRCQESAWWNVFLPEQLVHGKALKKRDQPQDNLVGKRNNREAGWNPRKEERSQVSC